MAVLTIQARFFGPNNDLYYRIPSTTRVSILLSAMWEHIGIRDLGRLRFRYDGNYLDDRDTLEEAGIKDGDFVDCTFEQAGGFSANGIYFSSPTEVPQLTLQVSLCPGLVALRHIFEPGQGWSDISGRTIEWNGSVSTTRGYGTFSEIVERDTGGGATGVSWNMLVDPSAAEASVLRERFALNDANAVVLAYTQVSDYFERTLPALSFDENAFDRFCLKNFATLMSSNYVAVRFLEQAAYEELVPLAISPAPDVVTRIVMVYENLSAADVVGWPEARKRKELGLDYWKGIIGFDERATDSSLYRALEWRVVKLPVIGDAAVEY